jgi:hypothetical protein
MAEAGVVAIVAEAVVVPRLIVAAISSSASVVLAGPVVVVVPRRTLLPVLPCCGGAACIRASCNGEGRNHTRGKDCETADETELDHATSALSQHSRRPLS